jgi:hypothetical protein
MAIPFLVRIRLRTTPLPCPARKILARNAKKGNTLFEIFIDIVISI